MRSTWRHSRLKSAKNYYDPENRSTRTRLTRVRSCQSNDALKNASKKLQNGSKRLKTMQNQGDFQKMKCVTHGPPTGHQTRKNTPLRSVFSFSGLVTRTLIEHSASPKASALGFATLPRRFRVGSLAGRGKFPYGDVKRDLHNKWGVLRALTRTPHSRTCIFNQKRSTNTSFVLLLTYLLIVS